MGTELNDLKKNNFRSNGIARVIENALNDTLNRKAFKLILSLRQEKKSFQACADKLNALGLKTRRGNEYRKNSVRQIYDRFMKYYDAENKKFKEGIVKIDSKNAEFFGHLKILGSGDVLIETNFKSYKAFEFVSRGNKNAKERATNLIGEALLSAKSNITVSNFLHAKRDPKDSHDQDYRYFSILERKLLDNSIGYRRFLQLPDSLWNIIGEVVYEDLPIESIIVSIELATPLLKSHLSRCFTNKQICDRFSLFIVRMQRTFTTFAAIDSDILIEEEFLTKSNRISFSNNINIYRAKKANDTDDIYQYIKNKKEQVLKLIGDGGNHSYPIKPIDKHLFETIDELLQSVKEDDFETFKNIFIGSSSKEIKSIPIKDLFFTCLNLLKSIESYKNLEDRERSFLADEEAIYNSPLIK